MNTFVNIELTAAQTHALVKEFVHGISQTDLKWLLNEIVRGNFHALDHNATVKMLRKIVNRECNLKEEA